MGVFDPIRTALASLALSLVCMSSVAAQVSEPTEDDFFAIAVGKWCRLDIRGSATIEVDFPSEIDGEMTVNLVSDRVTVETMARFVSFEIVEEDLGEFEEPAFDSRIVFSGSSLMRRNSDGSIVPSNFEQAYVFNRSFTSMRSTDSNGRQTGIYVRCAQINTDIGQDGGGVAEDAVEDDIVEEEGAADEDAGAETSGTEGIGSSDAALDVSDLNETPRETSDEDPSFPLIPDIAPLTVIPILDDRKFV